MDPMIGKMLDNRYELLEVIGSGGMAVVYKAKCHRLNRMVAVKVLKRELAQDADFRRRFRDESQAVAMLSHPNIVSVCDVSRGEIEYIVMELIDGITLKQYMEKRGQLNWREALHFITQIMKGLSHAHSRGLVHRDIKPQNIMVLRDGSVKVADFGIAYLQNSQSANMTQEAIGSVHYISPEQAKGNPPDVRSDIYSAGVVLYEMLTSRLPFEGDSAVSVAIQHLSSVPLTPREINPEVPEALELICMRAMASDIGRRYQSADEMIADLEEFRKNPDANMTFTIEDIRRGTPDEPPQPKKAEPVRILDEEEPREKMPLKKILLIAAGCAACVLAIVLLGKAVVNSVSSGSSGLTEYTVPNLIGKTMEEAQSDPKIGGIFTIRQIGQRYSDEYEAGVIIEQDPAEGKVGKMNREISVFISTGALVDTMPNLIGQEYRAAGLLLKRLNVKVNVSDTEEFSDDYASGFVIRTVPEAWAELHEGDPVILVVSKGAEEKPVTVPSFLTLPIDRVKEQLEELGLEAGQIAEVEDEQPAGTVVWQSIAPTSQVDAGTQIELHVSRGPAAETEQEAGAEETDE